MSPSIFDQINSPPQKSERQTYKLEIYRKPLEAIISGKKKVEIRTINSYEAVPYNQLR